MADVVKNERPDLAELRANLVVQIAKDKARGVSREGPSWETDGQQEATEPVGSGFLFGWNP